MQVVENLLRILIAMAEKELDRFQFAKMKQKGMRMISAHPFVK